MTNEELGILLLEYTESKGYTLTDEQVERMARLLAIHFPTIEGASLDEAREALGIGNKGNRTLPRVGWGGDCL